jgi:hypothetical protein
LPGTKECFTAKRYKGEIGKDYKRITLYLCSNYDLQKNEDFDHESEIKDEFLEPAENKSKSQVKQDEIIARELQSEFNNECNDTINIAYENEDASIATENEVLMQLADETNCSTAVLSEDDQRTADLKETPEENRNY